MKHSPYLSEPLYDLARVVNGARRTLDRVNFDAIVCTGVSGMLVAPALSMAMGKKITVVRKPDDHQNHAMTRIESGMEHDDRWIFVDDLCASGQTRERVRNAMVDSGYGDPVGTYLYIDDLYREYF